jgi:hypothetical protein
MNKTNFANGFKYFCADCGIFFDVKLEPDVICCIEICPICGEENILRSIEELLEHLDDNDTDPVNFYKAFPHRCGCYWNYLPHYLVFSRRIHYRSGRRY